MGWGCYRHEIDAGSENWVKKINSLLEDERCHKPPYTWGRDGQVCPFCWEELEAEIGRLRDAVENGARCACHASLDCTAAESCAECAGVRDRCRAALEATAQKEAARDT